MSIRDLPFEYFLTKKAQLNSNIVLGPGMDDCSVIKLKNRLLVVTSDFVNAKPASVSLGIATPKDIGYLAAAANLSDLIGTGATPTGFLLGVRLPHNRNDDDFDQIISGAIECLSQYDTPLIGGDTKLGAELVVYGVGIGTAKNIKELFTLSNAKPGDNILLSGEVGAFNAAVWALSKGGCPEHLIDECKSSILRPKLPLSISKSLASTRQSRGGTDLSDGLGYNLSRLARSSNVGLSVDVESIPIHPLARSIAEAYEIDPLSFVFSTGGDFQFIATGEDFKGMYKIGVITRPESGCKIFNKGKSAPLPLNGHDDENFIDFPSEIDTLVKSFSK